MNETYLLRILLELVVVHLVLMLGHALHDNGADKLQQPLFLVRFLLFLRLVKLLVLRRRRRLPPLLLV